MDASPSSQNLDVASVTTAHLSTWCEVSMGALEHNVSLFRRHVAAPTLLGIVVKANGYGHGVGVVAQAFLAGGADWLIVNSAHEAVELRQLQPEAPIYICGPVLAAQAPLVAAAGARTVVYDEGQVKALATAGLAAGFQVPLHIKIETGNQRQGLAPEEAVSLGRLVTATDGVCLEGIATHYADIEDTTDHGFARAQTEVFRQTVAAFREAGVAPKYAHASNSAATILYPKTHGDMVRVGISAYGHWPSTETFATALGGGTNFVPELRPALSWRARIAQIKDVPTASFIGYGRTYRTTHPSRIAVVPVGYHDGYDRRLSNVGHVLIQGTRAPIRGRVCMNMMMVDVTDIPEASLDSIVTLVGVDGDEAITAEQLAGWMGTINYEALARIHPGTVRLAVP